MSSLPSGLALEPGEGAPDDRRTPQRESISLLTLVSTGLTHRVTILRSAIAVCAAVTLVGVLLPRWYTASASFVPQARRNPSNLSAGLAAQLGINLPQDPAQSPAFYIDFLKSRPILGAVVESTYAFVAGGVPIRGTLIDLYKIREKTDILSREEAIDELEQVVFARMNPRSGVVTVEVRSRYADLSAQICRRLLELLNAFNLETRQSQAAAERRFIEGRLQEVRQELRRAEDGLQKFLLQNRDYRNSPELTFQQDRLAREVTMQQQLFTGLSQSYEQARIEEVRDTPVITVLDAPRVPGRPDRRGLRTRGVLALLVGGVLGLLVASWKEYMHEVSVKEPGAFDRFARLRRRAWDDVRRPWRLLKRLVTRASRSYDA